MSIVQLSKSRLDETPAREQDIPHYSLWADGSEYEVFWTNKEETRLLRRYHGPQFGHASGDWHTETENWNRA